GREGEDAAAVDRGVVRAVQLVGDGEASDRGRRAGRADADADRAGDARAPVDAEETGGEVDLETHARVGESEGARRSVDPARAATEPPSEAASTSTSRKAMRRAMWPGSAGRRCQASLVRGMPGQPCGSFLVPVGVKPLLHGVALLALVAAASACGGRSVSTSL